MRMYELYENVSLARERAVVESKEIWYCADCKHDRELARRIARATGWGVTRFFGRV